MLRHDITWAYIGLVVVLSSKTREIERFKKDENVETNARGGGLLFLVQVVQY